LHNWVKPIVTVEIPIVNNAATSKFVLFYLHSVQKKAEPRGRDKNAMEKVLRIAVAIDPSELGKNCGNTKTAALA
jgi:hypothetical protein